ncbi:glycosyltransferase family 90 protein [Scleroderma yunnanense]
MVVATKRACRFFSIRSTCIVFFVCFIVSTLRSLSIYPNYPSPHVQLFSVADKVPPLNQEQEHNNSYQRRLHSLEEHTYADNGLLFVNPNGPHPIFELIRKAEQEWDMMNKRASRTLDEAIMEYKRRYKRAPPLGFDKWWDYVVKHNVQLPDEYDEIYHDLEPFWGVDPMDLARTQEELEKMLDITTVAKTPSSLGFEIVDTTIGGNTEGPYQRINDILDLISDVEHGLPPMRLSFSHHDNPNMLSDWRIRNMALEAARNGKTVKLGDFPPITQVGWIQACPPTSPARQNPPKIPPLSPPTEFSLEQFLNITAPKSFIASHCATMDPCVHPELLVSHGQFLSHNKGPYPQRSLLPRFSLCKTSLHHDIRPPVPYGWVPGADLELKGDVPWAQKVDERLNWRGTTTGLFASPQNAWRHAHRSRLVSLANTVQGTLTILPVPMHEWERVGEPEEMKVARVNPAWMDVAFVGKPLACDDARGTCREMKETWEFRRMQNQKEEGRYKYIFDIDGNGWSGRFKRLIASNSLIFKATIYPEWYSSRIVPWVHYVPIQISYTDLYDALAFFRIHDDLAARIATQGKEWSQKFWRKEDMTAYLYRLLLEYARVASVDRDAMSYKGSEVYYEDSLDDDML